jgi:HlyD family secretion protein
MRTSKPSVAIALAAALGLGAWQSQGAWRVWLGLDKPAAGLLVSGNIEAHESVVGFKTVQAHIVELPFNEGQTLRAGELIARVDDTDYRQAVSIAEASLAVQQRQRATAEQQLVAAEKSVISDQADLAMKKLDYDRYQSLWQDGFSSTQQRDLAATALKQSGAALERDKALVLVERRAIEQAAAGVKSAEENLAMAKINLGYTTLTAPFDGVILVRQAELGELAAPGTPIVTLADLDHVWLRAYVNEPDIGRIRLGQTAAVSVDSLPGKRFQGRISFISSSAEFTPKSVETHAQRVTLVYRIKIDIDNSGHALVPGLPADAFIDFAKP